MIDSSNAAASNELAQFPVMSALVANHDARLVLTDKEQAG
jgi:hypothetical protein